MLLVEKKIRRTTKENKINPNSGMNMKKRIKQSLKTKSIYLFILLIALKKMMETT